MFDSDTTPGGVARRLREEMARHGIASDAAAARLYGKHPQQWVSRHMNGDTDWKLGELLDFCAVLGLDYIYAISGIRTIPGGDGGGQPLPPVRSLDRRNRRTAKPTGSKEAA